MPRVEALFSKDILLSLFILSIVGFIGTLIAVPIILVKLPPHYFDERHPRTWLETHHPFIRWSGIALKNLVGLVFFLAGIAMLFLPGQGVLTMLIGISLMDFPGKRNLERKFIAQPAVLKTINKIRQKFGEPPLVVEPAPSKQFTVQQSED